MHEGSRIAFVDWLACAAGGSREPAARAASALGDDTGSRVAAAATAGHVLDFDDTYLPGLAHLSAPTAPVALVLGAEVGATVAEMLQAYAAGFEAMAALTAANHPELRGRGWHPTAVFGASGAAVAAAVLLGLDRDRIAVAVRLSLLRAAGLSAAFGSDGKALQVGLAAADGVRAARLAAAGASVPEDVISAPDGFEATYGARWAEPAGESAIEANWIKAYPCCLQTHSAIEAAAAARASLAEGGEIAVVVHPVSLGAARHSDVADGLQAKFSIPYLVAFTLLHGPPRVESFRGVDQDARALAADRVRVRTDRGLLESEAVIEVAGDEVARVAAATGSPARPMSETQLAEKVRDLAGDRLDGLLADEGSLASDVLAALDLG